jgi:hypothetical protein
MPPGMPGAQGFQQNIKVNVKGSRIYAKVESFANPDDANPNFQIAAYDGMLYQDLWKRGPLLKLSKHPLDDCKNLIHTCPMFALFGFLRAVDPVNRFDSQLVLSPDVWTDLKKLTGPEQTGTDGHTHLEFKNSKGRFDVSFSKDNAPFPEKWSEWEPQGAHDETSARKWIQVKCMGAMVNIPSEVEWDSYSANNQLAVKETAILQSETLKFDSVLPDSTFVIPSSSARYIYDNDIGIFLKSKSN